jgi:hypothetical protein
LQYLVCGWSSREHPKHRFSLSLSLSLSWNFCISISENGSALLYKNGFVFLLETWSGLIIKFCLAFVLFGVNTWNPHLGLLCFVCWVDCCFVDDRFWGFWLWGKLRWVALEFFHFLITVIILLAWFQVFDNIFLLFM